MQKTTMRTSTNHVPNTQATYKLHYKNEYSDEKEPKKRERAQERYEERDRKGKIKKGNDNKN